MSKKILLYNIFKFIYVPIFDSFMRKLLYFPKYLFSKLLSLLKAKYKKINLIIYFLKQFKFCFQKVLFLKQFQLINY